MALNMLKDRLEEEGQIAEDQRLHSRKDCSEDGCGWHRCNKEIHDRKLEMMR